MTLDRTQVEQVREAFAALVDSTPVGAELEQLDSVRPSPQPRLRGILYGPAVALIAMALVLLVGGLTWLLRSPDLADPHVVADPIAPETVEGEWTRTLLEPGFIAEDLANTNHGLVAAAGQDGVWISSDGGTAWQQTLVVAYEPPDVDWDGELPKVLTDVQTVVEFDGAVYAIGTVWLDPDGSQGDQFEKRTTVWRSEDGEVWSESLIDNSEDQLQVIEAVANDDQILLVTRVVDEVGEEPPAVPTARTVILQSTDGKLWERLDTSGLTNVLWAISTFDDGYVGLGESVPNSSSQYRRSVMTSEDGSVWTEVSPWTITNPIDGSLLEVNYSVWPLVDLFETPEGLVAVTIAGSEPRPMGVDGLRPVVILATSNDGTTFTVADSSLTLFEARSCRLELEDRRESAWPPIQPPEGAAAGNRIILLGYSYPDNTEDPLHYQWMGSSCGGTP